MKSEIGSARAWFIYSLSALTFGYAFFHRVAPSVMVSDLMADFCHWCSAAGNSEFALFLPLCGDANRAGRTDRPHRTASDTGNGYYYGRCRVVSFRERRNYLCRLCWQTPNRNRLCGGISRNTRNRRKMVPPTPLCVSFRACHVLRYDERRVCIRPTCDFR